MSVKKYLTKRNGYILLIIIAVLTAYISTTDGGDFDVYLGAAKKLNDGQNIYAPPFVKGLQYYYSVFFALLLIPFHKFIFVTEFIWLLASYYWLYRIWLLCKDYFHVERLTAKQQNQWLLFTFLLALQFIMYNISVIQVTIFLLWAILESLRLIQQKKEITAGLLLALIINIKVMPILMLPYLFYRGYFKTIVTIIIASVALIYLPAIFIGNEYNNFLLAEWWKIINPQNKEHLFETNIGPHSLVALIPVYLTDTTGDLAFKRNFVNLDAATVTTIINACRLLLLAISLCYLRSMPFKKENNKLKSFWEIAYFLLIIPLLMPHQMKYAFLFSLPMIMYVLYFYLLTWKEPRTAGYKVIFILFAITILFYSPIYGRDLIGKFLFRYTQHFRYLTIATLLLIPVSLYCNPKKIAVNARNT